MTKEIKNENEEKVMDYELDPQIQDSIEKQYRRSFSESFKAREDKLRREKRKEQILTALIIVFILVTTCLLLIANSKMTNKAIDNCISNGHSENYCYEKLL